MLFNFFQHNGLIVYAVSGLVYDKPEYPLLRVNIGKRPGRRVSLAGALGEITS